MSGIDRRPAVRAFYSMKPISAYILVACVLVIPGSYAPGASSAWQDRPPNILIAISDDQSYPYASAYGDRSLRTPAFDRVAQEGVLFTQGFVASPGCSPSRAAFLTGRYPWQIEHAGTHASEFPQKYVVFPDLLEQAGYFIGYTGKGWGPGNWQVSGRPRNPAGPVFDQYKLDPPHEGISSNDYASNFAAFLEARPEGQPFYFWYGASEPHRSYEAGAGLREGKIPDHVRVPSFLPDTLEIKKDLLDYGLEIEWFDHHLGRMLEMLEDAGELDQTIVIVTSDNGMAFPRAKANVYEYGIHVPLAIRWGAAVPGGRTVDDLVSLVDLTPTILEAAQVAFPDAYPMSGRSILDILKSDQSGIVDSSRQAIYSARERHSSSRYNNLSYPQRAIRTHRYLYIRNFKPERWPAGAPRVYREDGTLGPMHGGYHDIDAGPTLEYLVAHNQEVGINRFLHLAVDRRPAEELFDIVKDPGCLYNLANDPAFDHITVDLRRQLEEYLKSTSDPRITGEGDIFDTYKRYSPIRTFPPPEWALPDEGR